MWLEAFKRSDVTWAHRRFSKEPWSPLDSGYPANRHDQALSVFVVTTSPRMNRGQPLPIPHRP
jgi:hypothetical protein